MDIRKVARRSGYVVLVLLAIGAIGFAALYFKQVPIPDLAAATAVDSKIHDERYTPVIRDVRDELDERRQSLTAPSISLAVAVDGELVWAEARGYADLESQEAATLDTTYLVGSVSKPITAALVAKLWEDGLIDLDADVREYVPAFPEKAHPVTLRQLLSHQAGIRHYKRALTPLHSEMARNEQFDTIESSLAIFKDDELLFEPDTSFNYSTYGYTLVSAAVEGATGRSFHELLEERVFEPLAMSRSTLDDDSSPTRVSDYVVLLSDSAVLPAPETNNSYKWAGGGIVSTPSELARFGAAMLRNELLSEATSEVVFTARKTADGELNPQHYGLGWRMGGIRYAENEDDEPEILPLISHGGSSMGSASVLLLLPEHDIVVAMTANSVADGGSGPVTSVAADIMREFLRFKSATQP
ncbi:MAG: serine hydrolase domain-containing protein [Woeseiaceae bacterium]|nr:serine hydrolase domain-containing protein [Woeseiaceae bacterium]